MMMTKTLLGAACLSVFALTVHAEEGAKLIIDGEELTIRANAPAHAENIDEVSSGWIYRSKETQALQLDDFDNPAFVFVDQAIDELLAEMTQQIQHLCMIYESAYKTTRLKKYKNEVQNLEDIMTSATNEFVLDDQRIILRIVCAEVWQQSDQKEYYLNLMNDN